jgi:hypothetical protein
MDSVLLDLPIAATHVNVAACIIYSDAGDHSVPALVIKGWPKLKGCTKSALSHWQGVPLTGILRHDQYLN